MKTFKWCILFSAICLLLSGCSAPPAANTAEGQRALAPYFLSGEKDGWEIRCVVREATAEEKERFAAGVREVQKTVAENFSAQKIDQKDYENMNRQCEQQLQALSEKAAYVSSIYGACRNSALEGELFDYQLSGDYSQKLIAGTQTASAEAGQWYTSWQTEGEIFIPPLEKATLTIRLEHTSISIPLTLSTHVSGSLTGTL